MDNCKTKQFIAFINKTGRDRFWCNGYFAWDEYSPNIHPYDTKEQKKIAAEIADSISSWSETGEIEGVILTVSQEVITFVNKQGKEAALERFEKKSAQGIQKQEEEKKRLLEEKKKKKDETTEDFTEPEPVIVQSIPPPVPVIEKKVKETKPKVVEKKEEPKKRSPLEIKSSSTEKEKKGLLTPSEPKKKSGLSKIIKEK